MSSLSLPLAATAPLDLAEVVSRLRTPGGSRVASAVFAPAAMLAGAVGLLAVWAAAPRWPIAMDAATPPVAVVQSPRSVSASAALGDDKVLARLLIDLGASPELTSPGAIRLTTTAADVSAELRRGEAEMVSAADQDALARLQAARAAFRSTGLNARSYAGAPGSGMSTADLRDAHALASALAADPTLVRQVQRAARDLVAARSLAQAAAALPLATPVDNPVRSSPFGARTDPFTGQAAFHPGQDFSGHYGEPIHVTAPGVVSFVGQRSGYGNCVEVDHGYGLKTRYGHMSAFGVAVGQAVRTGDTLGFMGSTGRSTGVHLHYEVWASGRLENPAQFLKAGAAPVRG